MTDQQINAAVAAWTMEAAINDLKAKLAEINELLDFANEEFAKDGTDSMAFHDAFQSIIRNEMCIQVFTNQVTDALDALND